MKHDTWFQIALLLLGAVAILVTCRGPDEPPPPKVGAIAVASRAAAAVCVDGESKGTIAFDSVPLTIQAVPIGEREVKVLLQYCEDWCDTVTVKENETTDVSADLLSNVGVVDITSEPDGAKIHIGPNYYGLTPKKLSNFPIGDYEVRLTLTDYADYLDTVRIGRDSTTTISANMRYLEGALYITTHPSGADVSMDGEPLGVATPTLIEGLLATSYELSLTLADHLDSTFGVTVVAFDTVEVHVALEHETGSLTVRSDPDSATIIIDGESTQETTDHTFGKIPTGSHTLTLSLAGYEDWSQFIIIEKDKLTTVTADLVSVYGSIAVSSTPSDAEVWIDGHKTDCRTPCTISDLNPGTYRVDLKLPAYLDHTEDVVVVADSTSYVAADLTQAPTVLIITSDPLHTDIWLNGEPTGRTTPDTIRDITGGTYDIRCLLEGRFPADTTITIVTGYTEEASLVLDPAPAVEIAYTVLDTIFLISADGHERRVLTTDYDSWLSGYISYAGKILWSPDGQYLAFTSNTQLTIVGYDGTVIVTITFAGSRGADFQWSHDSRYLVVGSYKSGIYRYDVHTGEFRKIMSTWCYCYDHCPTYSPDNSSIAFVHHEYGTRCYLYIMDADGGNKRRVSPRFGTGFDENIELTWGTDTEILFKTGGGVYMFDLTGLDSSSTVPPIRVVKDGVRWMRLTADGTLFAYYSSQGLHYGNYGQWEVTWLSKFPALYDCSWTPSGEALVCRTGDGLHWLNLDRRDYWTVYAPAVGRGAVSVRPK